MTKAECPTGKVRYKTAREAWRALARGAGGVMAYRCRDCWDWHTTSSAKQKARRR